MSIEQLNAVLLLAAVVLLITIGAVRFSVRTGLPSLLVYLAVGVVLGDLGLRLRDPQVAQSVGFAALVVILAEGGLTTRWRAIRPALPVATVLATVGVGISIAVTALAARLLLGASWQLAALLGAVVSSTDAAAVFSTLRRLELRPRLAGILEAESGFNDAPAVILVLLFSGAQMLSGDAAPLLLAGLLVYELVTGVAVGLACGWVGRRALRSAALPASGLYPVAVVAFAVLAYAAASWLHASGFIAVYLAGLVLGNADLPHRPATRSFVEGLAWLAQIGLFVLLGLLVTPTTLAREVLPAIGLGLVLLLLARPLSVLLCTLPFRLQLRAQLFLSWAGLRGAVPIVLATIPVTRNVPGSDRLFDLVFVLVAVFTVVQGPTLPFVARRLGVTATGQPRDLEVEAAPLEHLGADLLQLRIPPGSRLHGVELFELRLPSGSAVTLVVRGGRSFVPAERTTLLTGDELLIVTTSSSRWAVEHRLRAVSRSGKLAGWLRTGDEENDQGR